MTAYVDRTGQRIGPFVVEADHGRTRAGKVLWRLRHDDGTVRVLRTERVIALARAYGVPAPTRGWIRPVDRIRSGARWVAQALRGAVGRSDGLPAS